MHVIRINITLKTFPKRILKNSPYPLKMAEKRAKIESAMFALSKFAVNDCVYKMLVSERRKN